MEYSGKKIWEEAPEAADDYRRAYVEGIQAYIERKNAEGNLARRNFMTPEAMAEYQETYRRLYEKMLGLEMFTTQSLKNVEMQYVGDDEVCRIFRLTVYITDEIPFYAMLMIPHGAKEPMPLVITQHGGGGTPELCSDMNGKNNYNHMVQRVLARGAAALAPQLLLWSCEEIETMRAHNIPYDRSKVDVDFKRFGSSVTALEISGIRKSLDFVCGLEEIDADKIGMIGISYGGYFTLHTMAADIRIKAGYCAAVFNDRNIYDWSGWSYHGSALMFQDAEVAALCAPRKLYVQVGKLDKVFDYRTAIPEAERVRDYFNAFDKLENFVFDVWEGAHTISDADDGLDFLFSGMEA